MVGISQLLFNHVLCLGVCLLLAPCFFPGDVSAGWFDAATGQPVYTVPVNAGSNQGMSNWWTHEGDPSHAVSGGKNLFWKPCPPPASATGTFQEQAHQNLPVTPQPGTSQATELGRGPVTYPNLTYPDRPPPEQSGFGFGFGGFGSGHDRSKDSERRP